MQDYRSRLIFNNHETAIKTYTQASTPKSYLNNSNNLSANKTPTKGGMNFS